MNIVSSDEDTVLHFICPSHAARSRLIVDRLPSLDCSQLEVPPWFFVNMSFSLEDKAYPGMELALWVRRVPLSVGRLNEWLDQLFIDGLISAVTQSSESFTLSADLFLYSVIPVCFRDALAIESRRASNLLRATVGLGTDGASVEIIREEIARTYATLIPERRQRRRALFRSVEWLRELIQEPKAHDNDDDGDDPMSLRSPMLEDLLGVRDAMRDQLGELVQQIGVPVGEQEQATHFWRDALIARLVHLQVGRLWHLEGVEALRCEIILLRGLVQPLAS